jgi:serine-type D-Ala-D-Ala carboxypeptidase/endopeptidase (penicillin-binding protein 4)
MRPWVRVAVSLAVAVSAISVGGPAATAGSGADTASAAALDGTPVLSIRRLPAWIETEAAEQHLQSSFTTVVTPAELGPAAANGCVVVTQGSQVLYSANGASQYVPASTMKLLTATAVLDRLGASDRLVTKVMGEQAPEHGVIYGNLYLVGGGDPLLRTAAYAASQYPPQPLYTSLDQLALDVRRAGVTEVTGSVVGDESRYDDERTVPSWKPIYTTEGDVGPLSALDVNDGFVPKPPPPPKPPTPPTPPTTLPPTPGKKSPPATTPPTTAPPTTTHSTSSSSASSSSTGSSTASEFDYDAAANPPATAAAAFMHLLGQDGVAVEGGSTSGTAPAGSTLITSIASAPLGQEIEQMLTVSDDTAAELFTKELGYKESGSGTTAAGTAAIRADLAADGLPVSQLVNIDGSGLDRGDRVSCDLIVDALRRDGTAGVIAAGLPVAGKTGTLVDRMLGSPAAGRVHAKTGTLDGVVALSGFVTPTAVAAPVAALRQPVIFSIILNGPSSYGDQTLADNIAIALASYPKVAPLASITPHAG